MTQDYHGPVRSITDLARIAGVSVSTVSRALTAKGALNKDTRRRIQDLADRHGFCLNITAQNLRMGRAGAIAVLLPMGHERDQHLSDPFLMAMLGFLADELAGRGYALLLSRVIPTGENWLDDVVRGGRVDGIISIGQPDRNDALNRIAQRHVPLVVWGTHGPDNRYVTVGTDNVEGGRLVARHMLEHGRRRLAFFGNVALPEMAARHDGFLDALPPALRATVDLVDTPITPHASRHAAAHYFAAGHRPDGIFAGSDVTAMSILAAAAEQSIRVPDQLAVVGFDDIPLAALAHPPLTTVRQDIRRGAFLLVDRLFACLAGREWDEAWTMPELVLRQSG